MMKSVTHDRYLDLTDLASYSGLGKTKLRYYIKNKHLPAFRVEGKILVRQSEYDRWLQQFRLTSDVDRVVNSVMSDIRG